MKDLIEKSIGLLKDLIITPSFSKEEDITAEIIDTYIKSFGVETYRELNNVWAFNKYYDPLKPTILLNSHHDTVRPNIDYTRNPFLAEIIEGKLYGLGSNDAGGCLVSLISTFLYYYNQPNLKYNLVIAATAEEEILGLHGLEFVVPKLGALDFAIVGEPTQMHLAVAEKGLMVLECKASGKSGHAARNEGENAIYNAIEDILWFKTFEFPKQSAMFGPIKMSVTMINAGTQHNVVPSSCDFVVDVRITDAYTNEEVLDIIKANTKCEIKPRSTRLRPSFISLDHPIVKAGINIGRTTYGSPTTSDQAVLKIPSLKLGPGNSARSHTADEFVYVNEIEEGVELYIRILDQLVL
ncbi:acetylornithine deacetylase [Paenimyroides ummariense]|uniref:Acetylornithine deacetylase n=1 Tax=Paenimyroides ummariense TaxID=913024 RepID=A0A1I4ZEX1_9FLAO|nr:M20 family metallo-hydrolase [Paenimyroides ummariense]SFN48812.1 acetylornithine deacetylase [Paenimyroides ummariense]